jgi:hypothetical protein
MKRVALLILALMLCGGVAQATTLTITEGEIDFVLYADDTFYNFRGNGFSAAGTIAGFVDPGALDSGVATLPLGGVAGSGEIVVGPFHCGGHPDSEIGECGTLELHNPRLLTPGAPGKSNT